MLLIAARLPPSAHAFSDAAHLVDLSLADVRARLAGPLPRVLVLEPDPDRARERAAALEELGFVILLCDPRAVPGDDDRFHARALELSAHALVAVNESGEREDVRLASVALIQRGVRTTTTTEVTQKSTRQFDPARALLSGGLLLTKKVPVVSTRTSTSQNEFLLLHRTDADRDVIIYSNRVDYQCLGTAMQPSSTANFSALAARIREIAPARVPFDARVSRPGFVQGLPATRAHPVDLALWMVLLVHLRGLAVPG